MKECVANCSSRKNSEAIRLFSSVRYFKSDDRPDKFYVILNGSVSVYSKRPVAEVQEERIAYNKALKYMQDNGLESLKFRETNNKDILSASTKDTFVGVSKDKLIVYDDRFLVTQLVDYLRPEVLHKAKLVEEDTGLLLFGFTAKLPEGSIFGEKGLDEDIPRGATVLCNSECSFGIAALKQAYSSRRTTERSCETPGSL